jgi:benzoate-CoA ligase
MIDISVARGITDLPEAYNAAVDLIGTNLVAGRGNKVAVIDANGRTSYAVLAERIDRMANLLRDTGIKRGQRILLCLTDTIDFPTAFLGAIKAGIIPVPLNTLLVAEDYRWLLGNSGAGAVIVSGELSHHWLAIAAQNPQVQFLSSGDGPWRSLETLLAVASPHAEAAPTRRDETAFWLYTSGSTGKPKGAMHSHASIRLTANLYAIAVAGYCEDDVVLSVAKQFFAYGLGNSLTFPYAVGATVILHDGRATPQAVSALMRQNKVSVLAGVPTFFAGWLAGDDLPTKVDLPTLRLATSAGEALPPHLAKAFSQRFETSIIDGLGSTEMLHIYCSQRPGAVRSGCTGKAVSGYELRIIDDAGAVAVPGEIGELQVKGPTAASGYWQNPEKSATTFIGEWVRTGDKYICDREGWFTYAGRTDDMLKVGGIYVSPIEVEEALASHDFVLEAAVVGMADENGLTKPFAHVVLHAGHVGDRAMERLLKAHVKSLIAPFKYPRWFRFVEELPKTATGKIQRFRLRDDE